MSRCVFLFGEAAHGTQELAGNHTLLLTLGADKEEGGVRGRARARAHARVCVGVDEGGEAERQGGFSKPSGR